MAFTQRTITHTVTNADGTPGSGNITFTLTKRMTNGTTTIVPATITGALTSGGALSVSLYANDDAATTPTDAQWKVVFHLLGSDIEEFFVTVPSAGSGAIDLGSLLPGATGVSN